MKTKLALALCLVLFCSHDMYLKMDTYFISPNQEATIQLYNGTFDKSENTIDRDRMIDVSLIGNGSRTRVSDDQWTERDSITILSFTSGSTGTWVAGVSTKPRNIEMEAEAFNKYLVHDGVVDMLNNREENGTLEQDAIEKYSKHVKAIFQVGSTRTDDWKTPLGYPIEFVPMSNPYEAHTGSTLQFQLLRDGRPLAHQRVYAHSQPTAQGHTHTTQDADHSHASESAEHTHGGSTHSHDNDTNKTMSAKKDHQHTEGVELRTDDAGVLSVNLDADGIWYLRTIHMVTTEEEGLTHESNWATLTFEVTHEHEEDHEDDHHTHGSEDGFPSYVFWMGSIFVIAGLFFWFNRKR